MEKEQCFRIMKGLLLNLEDIDLNYGIGDAIPKWQKQYKDFMSALLELSNEDINWVDEQYRAWQNTEEFKKIPTEVKERLMNTQMGHQMEQEMEQERNQQ